MSIYDEALLDKNLAAKILLPVIECEGRVMSTSVVSMIQSEGNLEFLYKIYEICKIHGWLDKKVNKGTNVISNQTTSNKVNHPNAKSFAISPHGFKEIYEIAGPFTTKRKAQYARILCNTVGTSGKSSNINETDIMRIIGSSNGMKASDLQLRLLEELNESITYVSINRKLQNLIKMNKIKKEKNGKGYIYLQNK